MRNKMLMDEVFLLDIDINLADVTDAEEVARYLIQLADLKPERGLPRCRSHPWNLLCRWNAIAAI